MLLWVFAAAAAAQEGTLRAGAARVEITPPAKAALPMSGYAGRKTGFEGIHDNIYVRAIVIDDGAQQAAVLAWELIGIPNGVWEELSQRISKETGIPVDNMLIAGVHNHSAPSLRSMYGENSREIAAYTATVQDRAAEAVKMARAKLEPARVGAGTGRAYVNINRREWMPDRGWWWLGYNPNGPSDKAVTVIKFESTSGKPIALLMNYAVHAVVMGPENIQITGDLPGAASRFVEQHYQGGASGRRRGDAGSGLLRTVEPSEVVALWTSGAAGDQNPIALARGSDFTLVDALGRLLGEEVVRVAANIRTSPKARIRARQQTVTCPGQQLDPGPRPRKEYAFRDADPVTIRLSLLMAGDIALAGVSGEVLTMIGRRLFTESPFKNTVMVTHANGSSGYIPDDAAYDQVSYEITTSRLKRGCAENAIVNGFLEMMER
jgi:hypothetical protein